MKCNAKSCIYCERGEIALNLDWCKEEKRMYKLFAGMRKLRLEQTDKQKKVLFTLARI